MAPKTEMLAASSFDSNSFSKKKIGKQSIGLIDSSNFVFESSFFILLNIYVHVRIFTPLMG